MAGERYTCTLTPELLEKAVDELNEPRDNEKRLQEIDKLRERFLEEHKELSLVREDDGFLLRFLRARKFDQDRALEMLVRYHTCRQEVPEVFERVANPLCLKKTLSQGCAYILPEKDNCGRTVLLFRYGLLNEDIDMCDLLAIFILALEQALEDEVFQINGLNSIEDMDNFGLKVMSKMSTSILRKMTSITQDAMPVRYKVLNVVNEGKIFDILYGMFKHFVKKKLRDRVKVHGRDFTQLHEQVDPQYLPDYLGGHAGDPAEASIKWGEDLCEMQDQDTAL